MARLQGGLTSLMTAADSQQPPAVQAAKDDDARLTVVDDTAAAVPDDAVETTPAEPADSGEAASEADQSQSDAAGKDDSKRRRRRRQPRTEAESDTSEADLPRYLQLERKDVRMRLDQLDALTNLSRRLNKQRRGRGERITENTLVRVAIDLMLQQTDDLSGFTEDDLRSSVGA